MPLTLVDVFAGVGGLALGWTSLPTREVRHLAAIDSDESLWPYYARNFPNTIFVAHRFGNPFSMAAYREGRLALPSLPAPVNVLLAAPPCQPFSSAGKRSPNPGPDAYLGLHVCSLAEHLRPNVVLMENVPQFARVRHGALAGRVRVRFQRAGYATGMTMLDAVEFGVPQRRLRSVLLAIRGDGSVSEARRRVAHVIERLQRTQAAGEERSRVSVADAISDLPALNAGDGEEELLIEAPPLTDYQRALRQPDGRTYNHVSAKHSSELVERIRSVAPGEAPQKRGTHPLWRAKYFRLAYARLAPGEPAGTLTTNTHNPGSGRFIHYRDHRTLTVREVARLQGFPDSFRFVGSQMEQRRHVGNAVPPPLSRRIADVIASVQT